MAAPYIFSQKEGGVAMHLGEPVGELTVVQPDGRPVAFATFLGRPLLLVFLRHLA